MMERSGSAANLLLLVLLITESAGAQNRAATLSNAARGQIDQMDMNAAVTTLENALAPDAQATPSQRVRILTLLAWARMDRDRDGARNAAERAVRLDRTLVVDSLERDAPGIASLFSEARGSLGMTALREPLTVQVSLPTDTLVPLNGGLLRIETRPSFPSTVILTLAPVDNPAVFIWKDSVVASGSYVGMWNPRHGSALAGRYALSVFAVDSLDHVSQTAERIVHVSRASVDTQAHPASPARSAFQPETLRVNHGSPGGLVVGVMLGAAAAVLPTALASADLKSSLTADPTAYALAGTVSFAAIAAFIGGKRVRPLPENAVHNRRLREQYEIDLRQVIEANRVLRENAPVRIQVEGVRQ